MRKSHNNKYKFDNQVTLVYKYWGFRSVNCKIFNNGKLQITGVKYDSEVKWTGDNIVRMLKEISIPIYTSVDNLPKQKDIEKNGIEYALVYNPKLGKMSYYRWNYYNQFANLPRIAGHGKKEFEWNSDTDIKKFIGFIEEKKKNLILEMDSRIA